MTKVNLKKVAADAVTSPDEGVSWDFECPVVTGCGEVGGRGFVSTGWPSKTVAAARGRQHLEDHLGTAMPSLEEFHAEHGLTVTPAGKVSIADLRAAGEQA